MRRMIVVLICAVGLSPAVRAQDKPDKMACYASEKDNAARKKKLWDGYEISLGAVPNPEEVEYRCTGAIYNSAGRVVFRTGGPYGFTSMARQPFAEKVLRVREGKLVDVTPEFCGKIFSDETEDYRIAKQVLTAEGLEKLQRSREGSWDNEEVVSALLSRALQHVFCRQFDEAMSDLNLWPKATRAKMKADFAGSIREDHPEFAAKLSGGAEKK
jgi:hypothetical protein